MKKLVSLSLIYFVSVFLMVAPYTPAQNVSPVIIGNWEGDWDGFLKYVEITKPDGTKEALGAAIDYSAGYQYDYQTSDGVDLHMELSFKLTKNNAKMNFKAYDADGNYYTMEFFRFPDTDDAAHFRCKYDLNGDKVTINVLVPGPQGEEYFIEPEGRFIDFISNAGESEFTGKLCRLYAFLNSIPATPVTAFLKEAVAVIAAGCYAPLLGECVSVSETLDECHICCDDNKDRCLLKKSSSGSLENLQKALAIAGIETPPGSSASYNAICGGFCIIVGGILIVGGGAIAWGTICKAVHSGCMRGCNNSGLE